ncbi:MAG: CpsB/CapC family capsule biosynthesis tyrosine phosphatase [Gemmatimonadota bacterium]
MIDLHTHLLPGVDDGSPTAETSVEVLHRLLNDGVREVACTPHLVASQAAMAPVREYDELRADLQSRAPAGIRLHKGFEIMLDEPGCDLRDPALALGESRAVLVELPRVPVTPAATDELIRLRSSGIVPVIAHPERYQGIKIETLHIWRDIGVVVQGDGLMLLASGHRADFSRQMLISGVCDLIASDNHGDRRSLGTVRQWLHEVGGHRQARLLLDANPGHLLADELLEPVPPLRDHKSIWDRLRELFTGTAKEKKW